MIAALRLDEDLVPITIGEADDLVLDRRAVTRARRGDAAGVKGRQVEIVADERVRLRIGEGDVTIDLMPCDRVGLEGERHRLRIARLPLQRVEVDRLLQHARRRAGLQPAHRKAEPRQGLRQPDRGHFLDAAARSIFQAHVQETAQEGAGGHDGARRREHEAGGQGHPSRTPSSTRRSHASPSTSVRRGVTSTTCRILFE